MKINIIGAGLAGCEAAYQMSKRGYQVDLYEMRPKVMTPAHKTDLFAELVCSNSFRSNSLENAVGILKEELRMLDSLIIKIADENQVSAGGALAVSRDDFSLKVTEVIKNDPNINIIYEEVKNIKEGYTIICTGPLTSMSLSKAISEKTGLDDFYFFDAAAPIVEKESIDFTKAFYKSRYDKGEADYINCPMTKEEFSKFYNFLINAPCVIPKDFELKVFEGCMPVEEIARRGEQTLTFGPMKPVGLDYNDKKAYAVVQLRQDNKEGTLYNIVGFQTHLTWTAQKELMNYIPGLENAVIARYGVMHRNHYLNAPKLLDNTYRLKGSELFFGGQITGVEGYVESIASGMVAALNLDALIKEKKPIDFTSETVIGSLGNYISTAPTKSFQPMNATFGLLKELDFKHKKKERKMLYAKRALEKMAENIERL